MIGESDTVEYKFKLNDSFEKEVVCFLNSSFGGKIFIGVDDDGKAVGVSNSDLNQLQIKDRLKNNISPPCLDFCSVSLKVSDGFDVIVVDVKSGREKPYYIRKLGMSSSGCFKRVGSSCEPMSEREINKLYVSRLKNTLSMIPSPSENLTFRQLKIYYDGVGKPLGNNFLSNLKLLTPEGKMNYAAYLLSDSCQISIKTAKYEGLSRVVLLENDEFGNCSLMKAFDRLFDRLSAENKTFAKITPKKRMEKKMIDSVALRESVLNAFLHNDYSYSVTPKFEFFADRLEITSAGGLPFGMSREEFFSGLSVPRNPELMRVFRDLEYVEVLGSGVPRIIDVYGEDVFVISENFIRVVLPFSRGFDDEGNELSAVEKVRDYDGIKVREYVGIKNIPIGVQSLRTVEADDNNDKTVRYYDGIKYISMSGKVFSDVECAVLSVVEADSSLTVKGIADDLKLSVSYVEKVVSSLKKSGVIERAGTNRNGFWLVDDSVKKSESDSSLYKGCSKPFVVSANERLVFVALQRDANATAESISADVGISVRQVERIFARMKKSGVLRREGSRKDGHWVLSVADEDIVYGADIAEKKEEYHKFSGAE